MTKKTGGKHNNFVLTFDDFNDPSREQTARVLEELRPLTAEEIVPGTIRIEGERAQVESVARKLHNWHLSEEGILSHEPPHKSRVK